MCGTAAPERAYVDEAAEKAKKEAEEKKKSDEADKEA
jgi:hypothetical protein